MGIIARYRSFERPIQLLLLNQLTINLGFYMLIPYLADHLSQGLGLSVLLVGLILGVRNFSQQGMFLVGGSMADRFGYKPMIVAGCALRTGGFALIGLVDAVPALVLASAATGFAGALFNPAVRAYISHDAGERRVEAFALFSIFYQAGIVAGPLIGLVLTGIDFSVTCLVAAAIFAVLTVLQLRSLPARRGDDAQDGGDGGKRPSVLSEWREVASTRGFVPFSIAMIGTYVLSYQVYLALPLQARTLLGEGTSSTMLVAGVFAVSGGVTIAAQIKVTSWCRQRWGPAGSLSRGLVVLGAAFVPLLLAEALPIITPTLSPMTATTVGIGALLLAAAILAIGTAIVLPFEMDTIVRLSRNRLVATHYGLYNTICGIGILAGNAGTGWLIDLARSAGVAPAPWAVLVIVGGVCASALVALYRRGLLSVSETSGSQPAGSPDRTPTEVLRPVGPALDGHVTQPIPTVRDRLPNRSGGCWEGADPPTRPLQRVGRPEARRSC